MMEIIGPKTVKVDKYDFLNTLVGKKVLARNGEVVGRVADIGIQKHEVKGIVCKTSFGKIYLDKGAFDSFSTEAIVLKINPVTLLKGKIVFDSAGRKVGIIKSVDRDDTTNNFKSITVRGKIYQRNVIFKANQISTMKKNIILKGEYEG